MRAHLCLALIAALSFISVESKVVGRQDNSWDYLLMVTRWPGTVAYDSSVPSNVTSFTLHGIWPTRNDGSWPQFCNDSQSFDPSLISSLVPQLWVSWYDYQGNGFDFWSHEWDKHGTCAESVSSMGSEYDYFSSAINLQTKYDSVTALAASSITPNSDNWYSLADIQNALSDYFHVDPILTCQSIDLGDALDMIEFCVTKDFLLEDCPSSLKKKRQSTTCGSHVYLPPIPYDD